MTMQGMLGLSVILLVMQEDMKCRATVCSDRYKILQQELHDHCGRCIYPAVKSQCCEAENSSLEERGENHRILCG